MSAWAGRLRHASANNLHFREPPEAKNWLSAPTLQIHAEATTLAVGDAQ